MRRLVTLGALSLAASILGVVGCGDDDGDGGTGGTAGRGGSSGSSGRGGTAGTAGDAGAGGTAGTGGTPGNGGTGGTPGNGGTGGSPGNGGTGGNPGNGGTGGSDDPDAGDGGIVEEEPDGSAPLPDGGGTVEPLCTGCLELRVDFTGASQNAMFALNFPEGGEDFSDAVVTFSLRAPAFHPSGQLFVQPFVQDDNFNPFVPGAFLTIDAALFEDNETFVDIDLDVGAVATDGFDAATTRQIGLQLISGGGLTEAATSVLLLDSITYEDAPVPDLEFDEDEEGFAFAASDPADLDVDVTHQ